jgi:hypothetical protein
MSYIIKDDFLDKNLFMSFKEKIFSEDINWFFKQHMTYMRNDEYFFSHTFYQKNKTTCPLFNDFILPVLKKINAKAIREIRANLMLKKTYVYESDFHTDVNFACKTAILYMNTCNGYTVLQNNLSNINIDCIENRLLIFNSNILHKAVSQTDTERRIVINFNYFDDKCYE